MSCTSRLATDRINPEVELASFIAGSAGAGAVVSFCGIARPAARNGETIETLHLEYYPGMTEHSLQVIAEDGMDGFDVDSVVVIHRCGVIEPGEIIVFVAAASRFRRAAFEAADCMMDRLKTEAVFWKREQRVDGSRWIEPTESDRRDAARWTERVGDDRQGTDQWPESTKA